MFFPAALDIAAAFRVHGSTRLHSGSGSGSGSDNGSGTSSVTAAAEALVCQMGLEAVIAMATNSDIGESRLGEAGCCEGEDLCW